MYKGIRIDGKGWVEGTPFFISSEDKCFIIDNCQSLFLTQEDSIFQGKEVRYGYVCQHVDLVDVSNHKIYYRL